MTNERAFRGVWIPADLWLNRSLSIQEKVMLIEIDSLSKDPERGCYKKNQGFAEFFGLSKNRVSEIIKSLESKGFIRVHYQRQGKEIVERNIFIIAPFDKPTPPSEKCDNPFGKAGEPPSENREERGSSSRGSVEGSIMSPNGSACSWCVGLGYHGIPEDTCSHCQGTGREPTCNAGLPVDNSEVTTKQPAKADKPKNDVAEIFDYWCSVMNKSAATKLDKKREKAIKDRLKDGYPVEYIKTAIEKCSRTPHNMGVNDNGQKYNDITLICRSAAHIERFYESMPVGLPKPKRPEYPENQGVDASIHTSQMNPNKPGLRYGEEAQFVTELTDEHKANNEKMRGNLQDLMKGLD